MKKPQRFRWGFFLESVLRWDSNPHGRVLRSGIPPFPSLLPMRFVFHFRHATGATSFLYSAATSISEPIPPAKTAPA